MSTTLNTEARWYRVGSSYPATGCLGYDGFPLTARFKFHTPAAGASGLSWETQRYTAETGYERYVDNLSFNYLVTAESSGWESACGDSGTRASVSAGKLRGSRSVELMPDRDYYLWVWPRNSNYGRVRVSSVTVTVDGLYGTPSLIQVSDGCFGGQIPVSLAVSTPGAVHDLRVSCAGRTETLLSQSGADTCVWTPDLAVYASLLPGSGSAQAVFTCETFYGANSVGSSTASITLRFAPGSLPPALSAGWVSAAPYNSGAAAGFTVWIQGYTRAEVSFDTGKIACQLGASVASLRIRCAGVTVSASPYRTGVLTGDAEILCTVTDSRGQEAEESLRITVLAYAPPVITETELFRCDSGGTADDTGQYCSLRARVLYTALAGENSADLTAASKLQSASGYGTETALQNNVASVLGGFSPDCSYHLRLTAEDALGNSAVLVLALATQRWAMKFRPGGLGVGFGKAPEHDNCIELPAGWVIRIGSRVIDGS